MELMGGVFLTTEGVLKSRKPDLEGRKVEKSIFGEIRGRIDGERVGPIRSGDDEAGHSSWSEMRNFRLEMP